MEHDLHDHTVSNPRPPTKKTTQRNAKKQNQRSQRIAQERMDYLYITSLQTYQNEHFPPPPRETTTTPKLTEESDDDMDELSEQFCPVPYQKGYWDEAEKRIYT